MKVRDPRAPDQPLRLVLPCTRRHAGQDTDLILAGLATGGVSEREQLREFHGLLCQMAGIGPQKEQEMWVELMDEDHGETHGLAS